jgi:hypothetical protein
MYSLHSPQNIDVIRNIYEKLLDIIIPDLTMIKNGIITSRLKVAFDGIKIQLRNL